MTLLSLFATVLFGFALLATWVGDEIGTAIGVWVGMFTSLCFVAAFLFTVLQVVSRVRSE